MSFSEMFNYISRWTSLLLSRLPCPERLFWFLKVIYEPLEHCDFVDPQGCSWRSPYQTQNNLDYLKMKIVKVNSHIDNNIVIPTVCQLSRKILSQIIHQSFVHISITRLKLIARKGLMEGLQENLPELEETCPIYLLTKETKITRGPTTDISKISPGFMLQMNFSFFYVESIRGFTSTFCGYVLYYFTPLWVSIQNQTFTS